jgi:uncharacterized PurR-regulated membrane protein YhhQ (DUF165 family)
VRLAGITAAALYIGTVFAANWAIQRYGLVSVGLGLVAPAGVYFVGLAFTLRDVVQETLGRRIVIGCILVGALASWFVAPSFALASGVAFLCSEAADFVVYTPLAERSFVGALIASNTVGLVVDSALFLWLAFGSLALIKGQVVGKAEMTLLALPAAYAARGVIRRHHQEAAAAG